LCPTEYLDIPKAHYATLHQGRHDCEIVVQYAKLRDVSKQDAVKIAAQAVLNRATEATRLQDHFAALRQAHKLPPATGNVVDKAFFDDLPGEL
jgi:antitoxin VapB